MHELGSVNCLQMYLTRHIPGLILSPYWSRLKKTFWIDDYKDLISDSLEEPNSKKWKFWSEFFEEFFDQKLSYWKMGNFIFSY